MRYDHPAQPTNPYPDEWTEITGFAYRSALSLLRPLKAIRTRLDEDADYILQHDYLVDYQIDGCETRRVVVPHGLLTDLTSVPRPLRIFVGRVGPWLEAAILHDYLYIAWQDVPDRRARPRDRLFADRLMLRAMEVAGVGWLQRNAIYWSLRAFGRDAYARGHADRYVSLNDPALGTAPAFTIPN
jgi:hypothetical protein